MSTSRHSKIVTYRRTVNAIPHRTARECWEEIARYFLDSLSPHRSIDVIAHAMEELGVAVPPLIVLHRISRICLHCSDVLRLSVVVRYDKAQSEEDLSPPITLPDDLWDATTFEVVLVAEGPSRVLQINDTVSVRTSYGHDLDAIDDDGYADSLSFPPLERLE